MNRVKIFKISFQNSKFVCTIANHGVGNVCIAIQTPLVLAPWWTSMAQFPDYNVINDCMLPINLFCYISAFSDRDWI